MNEFLNFSFRTSSAAHLASDYMSCYIINIKSSTGGKRLGRRGSSDWVRQPQLSTDTHTHTHTHTHTLRGGFCLWSCFCCLLCAHMDQRCQNHQQDVKSVALFTQRRHITSTALVHQFYAAGHSHRKPALPLLKMPDGVMMPWWWRWCV